MISSTSQRAFNHTSTESPLYVQTYILVDQRKGVQHKKFGTNARLVIPVIAMPHQ